MKLDKFINKSFSNINLNYLQGMILDAIRIIFEKRR